MNCILAETLRGRHPADVNFRSPVRTETTEQEPASFLNGNPIAEIEQAHIFSQGLGKRYIKNPELTNPPMK